MTIELLLGLCYDTSAFRSKSHCSLCHSHRRGIDDRASHAGTAVRPRHTQPRYRKSASLMPVQQKEWAPACVLLQKARTRLAFQCRRDQVRAGPASRPPRRLTVPPTLLAAADKVIEKPIRQFTLGCCDAQSISGSGQKPALPHRNMGVCFDLQQRTLSIVFSVAP